MSEVTKDDLRHAMARVFALQAGLMAVIKTHPHPQSFLEALDVCENAGMSNMLHTQWPDDVISRYQQTVQQLRDQTPRQ